MKLRAAILGIMSLFGSWNTSFANQFTHTNFTCQVIGTEQSIHNREKRLPQMLTLSGEVIYTQFGEIAEQSIKVRNGSRLENLESVFNTEMFINLNFGNNDLFDNANLSHLSMGFNLTGEEVAEIATAMGSKRVEATDDFPSAQLNTIVYQHQLPNQWDCYQSHLPFEDKDGLSLHMCIRCANDDYFRRINEVPGDPLSSKRTF